MKCERCQPLIEDYFDGELDQQISSQVSEHMERCAHCSKLASEINLEREIYSRYHREVDVTEALWANVHARIREQKQYEAPLFARVREWLSGGLSSVRLSPVLVAALILFAIGITVGVMNYLHSRTTQRTEIARSDDPEVKAPNSSPGNERSAGQNTPGDKDIHTPAPPADSGQSKSVAAKKRQPTAVDPNRLVQQAEQKYLAAIAILSRDIGTRRRQLDPETRARFDFALAEIDHTIYATQQAVRGNPSDPIALGYLLTAYSKKVEFLRDTARDDTEANRQN